MADRLVYVVLLHSPMVDRTGKQVTTAVTNLDLHDIARSCRTYGITRYFVVNPEVEQERLVKTILGHWREEVSKVHHPSRAAALETVRFMRTFEEAFNEAS
ncbi:MAG: RNA methyltransferase, partial [Deltaproteobacteria bacterium]|nr:RNA methyltransferase [Deltaproteobacteria bacterium]